MMQTSKPTAERILDAAEDAFAQKGYDATSLGEVAALVGISGPGIYKHFEGKRALYEAVLARLLDPFFQIISDEIDDPLAKPEVLQIARTMLLHHVEHPNLARLVQHAALAGGDQLELLVERWYRPVFERAQTRLFNRQAQTALPEQSIRTALMAFNSMILGYINLAPIHSEILRNDPLTEQEVSRFYDMICLLSRELQHPLNTNPDRHPDPAQ
ncbi:MAG: TetR/AcrR family transcriptional regulator [bacterium]|nr:TetR/AcrR family transcriptional regulator [bacterium]